MPPPEKFAFKRNSVAPPKRKPVHPDGPHGSTKDEHKRPVPKPPLPRRKPVIDPENGNYVPDELLVVEAPYDSGPNSPAVDVAPDVDLPEPKKNSPSSEETQTGAPTVESHDPETEKPNSLGQKHGMEILSATDGILP